MATGKTDGLGLDMLHWLSDEVVYNRTKPLAMGMEMKRERDTNTLHRHVPELEAGRHSALRVTKQSNLSSIA